MRLKLWLVMYRTGRIAVFRPVAEKNIEVDMIVQNIGSNGTADFTLQFQNDYEETKSILCNLSNQLGSSVISGDNKIVKLSIRSA